MIILFTYQFPFHKIGYGGGQQIIRGFAKALASLGHEIYVICPGDDELNLSIFDTPVNYIFSSKYDKRFSFYYSIKDSIKNINKIKPDLVCSFTAEASVIIPYCRIKGIKNSTYIAAPILPNFFPIYRKINISNIRFNFSTFLQMIGVSFCHNNFVLSDYLMKQLVQKWFISSSKIHVLGCGVSDVFLKTEHKASIKYDFISIGRIALKQKPLDKVAEALSKVIDEWKSWTIVGTGEDELALKNLVRNLGIDMKVTFVGTKSSVEICQLLNEHKIVLLPSAYESFFITAFEALSLNKIVVTNNVADLKTIFSSNKNLIINDDLSASSFLHSIQSAIDLFNQQLDFDSRSEIINNYTWDKISRNYTDILNC